MAAARHAMGHALMAGSALTWAEPSSAVGHNVMDTATVAMTPAAASAPTAPRATSAPTANVCDLTVGP
jgi:hypothetical protein